ncbi:MAG: SGNH/GDSL hydrolase family protein [Cyanobacteria bacterium J06576_12]
MNQIDQDRTISSDLVSDRNSLSLDNSLNNISELYVFGDLFSDTGNLFDITSEAFGTGFPSSPFFEGRYANGELWAENLAAELDIPYNFDTNFALIGATTGLDNVGNPFESDDVVEQLGLQGTLAQVNNFVGSTPNVDPDGLYTVWAGTYDLGLGLTDTTGPVNNIITAVENLANAGAKNILVPNLPDFDRFPGAQDLPNAENQGEIIESWNFNLSQALDALETRLDSDVTLIQLDTNALFDEIQNDPAQFGFTNASDRFILTSANESGIIYDETNPGANPDDYVFFGGTVPGVPAQPSAATHEIISQIALSAIASEGTDATEQFGTSENDRIRGTRASDNILGLSGNDRIRGGRSSDVLNGSSGDDRLRGNEGDDSLLGGSGNDFLVGGI